MSGATTQNAAGQWVPVIPLPLMREPVRTWRHRCECGARFWRLSDYEAHYAYVHLWAGRSTGAQR